MKHALWISMVAAAAATLLYAQGPRPSGVSPAAQPRPKTVTAQEYAAAQIAAGERQFAADCGFCHGRDAAGGASGPDLTRSTIIAEDNRGDKLGAMLRVGRVQQGMPAFDLDPEDLLAVAAFIHTQKDKFETMGGGRRAVDPEDLLTGDAVAGKRYFETTGACTRCHSASGDLAGVGARYQGLALLQRMLNPIGRSDPSPAKAIFSLPSGQTLVAPLVAEDEFSVTVLDPMGERQTYDRSKVAVAIDDPMDVHFDQLAKYRDKDMHDVFAYLNTLK